MFTFLGWIHNFKAYFLPKKMVKLKLIKKKDKTLFKTKCELK